MIYVVSYDLNFPGQRYEDLTALLNKEGAWARIGGSVFLLESDKTPVELRDLFKVVLDSNDKLYVGLVMAPAAWTGMPEKVSEWIKERL